MTYRLSARAEQDLLDLYAESVQLFGVAQADRYFERLDGTLEFVAEHPMAARERSEYRQPVRIHKAHVIVYRMTPDGIFVVRLRHGHSNWRASPEGS